ncbi:MAG: heme-binding protein [Burkholderiales bacterium]|nr:heme-binding protein [Burkholderiales bacterium]
MAIEEPSFRVLEQDGAFALREYAPYVVAETRVESDFESAGNAAFQRLFRYISGQNVAQEKIAMTAPVTQARSEARGEKIAMTAPVTQVAAGNGYRVAFTLPSSYTLETAPTALDKTIEIRAVPAQLVASWRYSGRWTESNYRESEIRLREQMAKRDLEASGEPTLARYNPPFMPSFLRRNEVLIPVKPTAAR